MTQTPVFHKSIPSMNSQLDIVLWGIDDSLSTQIIHDISEEMMKLVKIINKYDPEAELYKINESALYKEVILSETLWEIIKTGNEFYEKTLGYFDISLGSSFMKLKNKEPLAQTSHQSFHKRVHLNDKKRGIAFLNMDVNIDLGGMGKGLALEKIGEILKNNNVDNVMVNFGGSSIMTRGHHPHGDHWPVSLAGRIQSGRVWKMKNDCLSISSNQWANDHQTSDHILDPMKNNLSDSKKTAVVLAKSAIQAEVLSTALIAAPETMHKKIVNKFDNINFELLVK